MTLKLTVSYGGFSPRYIRSLILLTHGNEHINKNLIKTLNETTYNRIKIKYPGAHLTKYEYNFSKEKQKKKKKLRKIKKS